MLKNFFCLIILVFFQLGCTETKTSKLADLNSRFDNNFKVAMLIDGNIKDSGWSQSGYQGLKLIETELEAKISYVENVGDKTLYEKIEIIRRYAKSDFDYIIGHGGVFQSAIETVAVEFPRIKFALTSSSSYGNNHNLGVLNYKRYEAGYLAGIVAAVKTKNNKIGFIGGINYNTMEGQATLLERGAKSINSDIDVKIEWVGSWIDTVKGEAIARNLIASNFDVLVLNGDKSTESVYPIAKANNTFIIEWTWDKYEQAPEEIMTTIIIDVPQLLLQGATLVREGHWQGRKYSFGLREGVIRLAPFRKALNSQEKAILEQAKDDILTGKINLLP